MALLQLLNVLVDPLLKLSMFEHIYSVVIVHLSRLDSGTMDVLAVLDNWCVFLKTYQGL